MSEIEYMRIRKLNKVLIFPNYQFKRKKLILEVTTEMLLKSTYLASGFVWDGMNTYLYGSTATK